MQSNNVAYHSIALKILYLKSFDYNSTRLNFLTENALKPTDQQSLKLSFPSFFKFYSQVLTLIISVSKEKL